MSSKTTNKLLVIFTLLSAVLVLGPGTAIGAVCGDGSCEGNNEENFCTCPDDCPTNACGDGCVYGSEECDNESDNSDVEPDACRGDCTLHRCGDGVNDSNEACDDGSDNSDFVPDACRDGCVLPRCGDGVIDPANSEQCDLGVNNSDDPGSECTTLCFIPFCGNGVPEAGEQCDDGNTSSADDCTALCRWNVCGDSFVDVSDVGGVPREVCDDGNNRDGDECRYDCGQDLGVCGNGVLNHGEDCDEAVANSDTPNAPCRTDCSLPRCGDGVVDDQLGEICDGGPACFPDCNPLLGG